MLRSLLILLALFAAGPARAEWWEARTDHFIVYSETSAADAKEFAEKLERFDGALRSLQNHKFRPVTSDAQRLTVYRFGDVSDISRLAGGEGVAGFYIPRLGGSVAFTPARAGIRERSLMRRDSRTNLDPQSVLFHEYAHHFMFQHFSAAYPSWYIEGFAETAATIEFRPDGSFHLGNPPQYRSDMLLSGMLPVTATSLLTNTDKPDFFDFYGNYTVGWLLNHYLSFEPSRQGQLTTYLRLINDGTDPVVAAQQAFGNLRKLDSDLARYKNSGRLGGADVRPNNYAPPTAAMRKLTEDEEAIMAVRVRSKRGVSRKTSPDVARDARSIASRYPQSFAVQLALAEAELDTKSYAAAEAAVDRALALQPASVEAMLIKGQVYLERGKNEKALLPTARIWFAKAYEADPQHPASLVNNYLTYFHQGGTIPENALIGLERAFDLALYDSSLRLILARQLIAEKKGPFAKQVLQPLALSPHESKRAKAIHAVVASIDGNRLDEAYSKLAAEMKRIEDQAEKGS